MAVEFDLEARDILLVYFFTTIGINASFKDLLAGGKPLVILLAITIGYMVVQNLTGISVAAMFDLNSVSRQLSELMLQEVDESEMGEST